MAKGQYGASMGGSMEYRYSLKPETTNCRNCIHYKRRGDPLLNEHKYGRCNAFGILISDCTNARLCKSFKNKHGVDKAKKSKGTPKKDKAKRKQGD